ncbi:anti-sigma factor [Hyphomonas sp.]|uniref:anti-sigma factor n=1 Tax=Hyphomonas sp. TaxID=87 RepID=UPI0025C598BD|nr:anti-sigma factor [Hyphomonas sp.]MBI1399400.1 hypothetical protein [Hyphomonas sp.]
MRLTSSDREALAIAMLTGQATDDEVRHFEALHAEDASFRSLVVELRAWLAPLESKTQPPVPLAGLRSDILEGISSLADADRARRDRGRGRVHWSWRPAALLAAAVAMAAIVYPAVTTAYGSQLQDATVLNAGQDPGFVAALSGNSDAEIIVIVYDPRQGEILARYSNVSPPTDGVWQLWLIRDGSPAPRSLGLFLQDPSVDGQAGLTFSEDLVPASDLLAISLEPVGGSPEAGPTGPVLFTGKIAGLS